MVPLDGVPLLLRTTPVPGLLQTESYHCWLHQSGQLGARNGGVTCDSRAAAGDGQLTGHADCAGVRDAKQHRTQASGAVGAEVQ